MELEKTDGIRGATELSRNELQGLSQKLANPLAGLTLEQLSNLGDVFSAEHGITGDEDVRNFRVGAQLAGSEEWENLEGLTDKERQVLRKEEESKWTNPWKLYLVVFICSLCATVQGMDETVVNGAQGFYKYQFGIAGEGTEDTWLLGLVNGAPYMFCAIFGCWLTHPLNKFFGRRGTIFISQVVLIIACIWQALTNSWWHLLIARCSLGLGLGPVSATTRNHVCGGNSPPRLRGALVMQWQTWTAFGIMCGYAADLAFFRVEDAAGIEGLKWRLMLASAAVPAFICACAVWTIPESPRWHMSKGKYKQAYRGMCRLRFEKVQAARDLFYADALMKAEFTITRNSRLKELFKVRRNRNAFIGSEIVMFMQQFCGINVVAYYSTEIFLAADFNEVAALCASLGFGVINFLFALPALWTIDSFGRRNLLLTTFPLMAIFLLWCGFSFWLPEGPFRIGMIITGLYLFGMVYSPGEGPVPFTYSAEAYPLYIRPLGMSFATATTWFFNFVLAVTWPSLQTAMTATGGFGWYAAWNVVGLFLVLFFVPETKGRTLEELDDVFDVPLRKQMAYGRDQGAWFIKRHILRKDVEKPQVPLASRLSGLGATELTPVNSNQYASSKASSASSPV